MIIQPIDGFKQLSESNPRCFHCGLEQPEVANAGGSAVAFKLVGVKG